MLEMAWAPLPVSEKLAIYDLLSDPWALVGGVQNIEDNERHIERANLFTFTYNSDVCVDDFTFRRAKVQGQQG
jgi:hypothetical protein